MTVCAWRKSGVLSRSSKHARFTSDRKSGVVQAWIYAVDGMNGKSAYKTLQDRFWQNQSLECRKEIPK
jgi:hypothetical protein